MYSPQPNDCKLKPYFCWNDVGMPASARAVDVVRSALRLAEGLGVRERGDVELCREGIGAVARVRGLEPVEVLEAQSNGGQCLRPDSDQLRVQIGTLGLVVDEEVDAVGRGQVVSQIIFRYKVN